MSVYSELKHSHWWLYMIEVVLLLSFFMIYIWY